MAKAVHALTRNYLRLCMAVHVAHFFFHLVAKDWLFLRYGVKDESLGSEPGVEDFMTYTMQALLMWIGITGAGLFSFTNVDAAAIVNVVGQVLSLGTLFLPSGVMSSKYFHSVPMALAPLVVQIAFGVVALLKDGTYRLRFGQADSSPYLDVAVALSLSLHALFGLALCFNYGGFLSGLMYASSDLLQPGIHAYGEFAGWAVFVAAAAVGLMYMAADSAETRAAIGGMLVVLYLRAISVQDELQLIHMDPTQAMMYNVFGVFSLLVGIRLTLGESFWEEGGLFQLRNAVLVLLLIATGLWFQLTFNYTHFLMTWMPQSRAAKFLTGPCEDMASLASALQASVYLSIWCAWVTADRAACRASLLATMLSVLMQTPAYLLRSHAVGFHNAGLLKLVALQGIVFIIAFKALADDLHNEWGAWFRSLFSWSYAPIKGGLYMHVIYRTVWGLMFLFFSPMSRDAVPIISPAEGISPWHINESHLMQQYVGVHVLAGAETLYLLARVADRPVVRIQMWMTLAFYMATVSFLAAVRNNPTSGLVAPDTMDAIVWGGTIIASLSALYWDFWHAGPTDGRGREWASTTRRAAAASHPAAGEEGASKASRGKSATPTTPTTPRRGRTRRSAIAVE